MYYQMYFLQNRDMYNVIYFHFIYSFFTNVVVKLAC